MGGWSSDLYALYYNGDTYLDSADGNTVCFR